MSITDQAIQGAALDQNVRNLLQKINDGAATAIDINATNMGLAEKDICRELLASTATRVSIESRAVSLPFKTIALSIANV
jgi:hypothetical protein